MRGTDSSDSASRGSNPLPPANSRFQNVSFPGRGREGTTKRAHCKILDTANPNVAQKRHWVNWFAGTKKHL